MRQIAHAQAAAVLNDRADGECVGQHPNAPDRRDALPQHAADLAAIHDDIKIFPQAMMPALDMQTGRVLCRALTGDAERLLRDISSASFADLLVLGTTRRGALAGAVLGTTATHVLRTSRTPMLVARGALPDRPLRVRVTDDLPPILAREGPDFHEVTVRPGDLERIRYRVRAVASERAKVPA